MQFLLSMIAEEPDFSAIDPAQMQEIIEMMDAYNKSLYEAGAYVVGGGLQQLDQSKTVRFPLGEGDSVVSDGPFAETKEQLAGFWIIEADGIDEAVAWARRAPIQGAAIEVRPFGHDVEFKPGEVEISAAELLDAAQGKGGA
jgi:hypothetical protein